MARLILNGIDISIDAVAQRSSTTIGGIGYAVVVATSLPDLVVTLTSSYLALIVGNIAASHLCSLPGGPPIIDQHVLPGQQPGQTHAQACLLDHVAELRNILQAYHSPPATVTITIANSALEHADRAWGDHDEPPT